MIALDVYGGGTVDQMAGKLAGKSIEETIEKKSEMPSWAPEKLKHLRLRLGMSQCDFARKLSTTPEVIRQFEDGRECVTQECANQLQVLLNQAEMCSQEVYSQPQVESELQRKDLNQIESSTV